MHFVSLQIPTDVWLGSPELSCPKAKKDVQAQTEFYPRLVEMASCFKMHRKAGKGVVVRLVTIWPHVAHCSIAYLNWVMLKSTKIMWIIVWVKLGAPSPICPWCFIPNNSFLTSQAHSTAEYSPESLVTPLHAWWHLQLSTCSQPALCGGWASTQELPAWFYCVFFN